MKLDNSSDLFNKSVKVIPGGVNSPVRFYKPFPFFIQSGYGSSIVTVDHETLLDYCMGYGSVILGHSYSDIVNVIQNCLDEGTMFCIPTEREVHLAEILTQIIPCAEKVRIVNTGSEATMTAIRLSRAYTKKKKIIKFEGGYHGAYDYVLVKAGSGSAYIPSSEGSLDEISRQTVVVKYNDLEDLENAIKREGNDISCLIIEPVLGNYGLILPEKDYLNRIRQITKQHNIVLIFDEVITGFRLSLGGGSEFFGIKPDLATFSKAMGNGFPVAAICGKDEIMDLLSPVGHVYQASTYAGNPVSVSAAIATIDTLKTKQNIIYPKLARLCDTLVTGIKDNVSKFNQLFTINSIGSLFQIFFSSERINSPLDVRNSDQKKFDQLFLNLLNSNIFIPPSQFESCFISYSHTDENIERTIEVYSDSLIKIMKEK